MCQNANTLELTQ